MFYNRHGVRVFKVCEGKQRDVLRLFLRGAMHPILDWPPKFKNRSGEVCMRLLRDGKL